MGIYFLIESTTPTIQVSPFTSSLNFEDMYMVGYTILGINVVAGGADQTHFDLVFKNAKWFHIGNWLHANDSLGSNRIPILLTGAPMTHNQLSPMRFISKISAKDMNTFIIEVQNPDGTLATFTKAAFIFYLT